MTRLMEHMLEQLRSLPEPQQDKLAEFVLFELAEDERWTKSTLDHTDKLKGLIDGVLKEDANGQCPPMDAERL